MPDHAPARTRPLHSLLGGAVLTALFVGVTGWILLAANGYVVNLRTFSVERRSLLSLAGSPTQASVTVDGQLVSQKLPLVVRGLVPGQHAVRISAPGYHDWELAAKVASGQAIVRDTILLFRTAPVEQPTGASTVALGLTPVDPSLAVNSGELSLLEGSQRRLITRFSQPILAARLGNDRAHVYVQLASEVLVTELDGANTTVLFTLDEATPATILASNRDNILTVKQGSAVRSWQIR